MKCLALLLLAAGCGQVTEVPTEQDAGPAPTGVADKPDSGDHRGPVPAVDSGGDVPRGDLVKADSFPAVPTVDAGPVSCSAADGCAACVAAGPAGPGYANAQQCREVITCVLAGDGGTYPWQSCHNVATGGGAQWGGLACAQQLVKACPP
jgi:hypothetical protein